MMSPLLDAAAYGMLPEINFRCYSVASQKKIFVLILLIHVTDFKKELRALNRELQLHILELADVLVERPSQYARRVEEISLIFKNLHHLLNSLRPHQVINW